MKVKYISDIELLLHIISGISATKARIQETKEIKRLKELNNTFKDLHKAASLILLKNNELKYEI